MNIFERAIRKKLRFASIRGELTTEQLFDLPLTSGSAFSLDGIARSVHAELQEVTTASFVDIKPDPRKTDLTLQLDILKHVIAAKQKAIADAENTALKTEKRRKLIDALAMKEDQERASMSREDILKELEALDE